jgi:hypothetical protein
MRAVAAVVLVLATAAGCGYWKARPAGDTAPARWGDAPADRDAASAFPPGTIQREAPLQHGSRGVEARFRNLDSLRRQGVIGQAEYRERRQDILTGAFE